MAYEMIEELNRRYELKLTGLSACYGSLYIPKTAIRIVVNDYGNGLGRVLYIDYQNRLIKNRVELI